MGHDHDHSRGGHGHSHAGMCGGLDHHTENYTEQQRADLDLVLAFNRRMADAINAGRDPSETERFLDPDPLRYMWVDEGQGQLRRVIGEADDVLSRAPELADHVRREVSVVPGSQHAARPTVATHTDGTRLVAWVEWIPEQGDVIRAVLDTGEVTTASGEVKDLFRPTAAFDGAGTPWLFFGASETGLTSSPKDGVAVWATRFGEGGWSAPERLSGAEQPAFNQEVALHADGSLEVVWQGRADDRFAVYSRTMNGGAWSQATTVTDGVDANVWDPSLAAFADGTTAYAWTEYREGTYRVACRRRLADGTLTEPQQLTSGRDYALHPHLAVTNDQQLWCAFDVITVHGHGGSGPTKLRADAEIGALTGQFEGMRDPGASVPPELLPEVEATIRVVAVDEAGIRVADGGLAPRLNVVPSGLPKLVATPDGGLSVAYRIHRQLPLMTYYWEIATQSLGPDGWSTPDTYADTDGTLEEPAIAATADGFVVVAQTDARLERALLWTEGFGGRECPYLMEHHGSVIWHGIHGVGTIVSADAPSTGPVPQANELSALTDAVWSDTRSEARRWAGPGGAGSAPRERPIARVGDREFTLYWGDLHRHSLVSRCTSGDEPSLEDFYRYAWDVCEYDFWAVTDHSENSSDYQWWAIQKIADLFHVPDRFVPLYGFEWTSADSGHQNVIYGDVERGAPIFSAFAEGSTDPDGLWAGLAEHPDYPAITIPHHPGSAMVHNDWDYHDPRFSRLVEIFQACRGNYEGLGCFRQYSDGTRAGTFTIDGLLRGHKFGLIASSDHGHGASYVGAYATSLSRADIFDALYQRRTFAATTRDVGITLSMGDVFMGEEAAPGSPRDLRIDAFGYGELARIDLVKNGEVVHALVPKLDVPDGWLTIPLRLEWGESEETTDWHGDLRLAGGAQIVRTPYWSPEICEVSDEHVAWRHTTFSFGEPYGAQRGGIEVTVVGPPEATVSITVRRRFLVLTLAELAEGGAQEVPGSTGKFWVQPGIGGLTSLGTTQQTVQWQDSAQDTAFYYARVFQTDGEMAWSSPIWINAQPEGRDQ